MNKASRGPASKQEAIQTAANLIGSALQRNDYEEAIRFRAKLEVKSSCPHCPIFSSVDFNGTILDYSANPEHPLYVHRDVIAGRRLYEDMAGGGGSADYGGQPRQRLRMASGAGKVRTLPSQRRV